ncbi:L,D-transpeptidase family protein [Streptomyces decoyicus]|uniref:L,D-transpeptidase family protein n=1 Tax=Streptomyces decoyicus TaxID=249567 RepID=A0ABZ1FI75_9ACTN|nr:L,D-transpeptidase family protein [Streptomyces decoyicus]WSB69398.1 L,D-transpeptidase family protein [Streptomyces decoyicus]
MAAVLVVAALAVGCRPVQVTGTASPDSGGIRYAPTTPAPPPLGHQAPPAPAKHTTAPRPHRTAHHAPPAARPLMAAGSRGAQVRELQARLAQLGLFDRAPTGYYASMTAASVRAFQKRQGLPRTGAVQPTAWRALKSQTRHPSHQQLYPPTTRPVGVPDPRCMRGRVICISKRSNTLTWMVDGEIVSAMDVRFGAQYTPTREGAFALTFKSRHHVSTIYHTAMPYAMFFSGGQAVHYSADFAARGYSGASHGCVNVRDKNKIAALFHTVKRGTKVVVYH